jgi:tRNA 2-selenouridine synthase
MVAAPRVSIAAPRSARAAYLARAYADLTADASRLAATVDLLRQMHPRERIADWQAMAAAGDFATLADSLMEQHYDQRYAKHRARMADPVAEVTAGRLDAADLPGLAAEIARVVLEMAR